MIWCDLVRLTWTGCDKRPHYGSETPSSCRWISVEEKLQLDGVSLYRGKTRWGPQMV
jgi:hypothetical protein